jgi:hypothetical protein
MIIFLLGFKHFFYRSISVRSSWSVNSVEELGHRDSRPWWQHVEACSAVADPRKKASCFWTYGPTFNSYEKHYVT